LSIALIALASAALGRYVRRWWLVLLPPSVPR
jgi:hypothetical protein